MFMSTEHSEGHLPPPVHLPVSAQEQPRDLAPADPYWQHEAFRECCKKISGKGWPELVEMAERKLKEKYVLSDSQSISNSLQRGRGTFESKRKGQSWWETLKVLWFGAVSLTNCTQFIFTGFSPSHFINLFKVSIKKLFSTLLHLLPLSRSNCQVRYLSARACSCQRQQRSCSGKVWIWTFPTF